MTKRKANTPIKRKQMIARTALKNLCIAMVLGEAKYCTVMNYKSCNEVKVSQQVAELIAGLPWKWYFECSVSRQCNQNLVVQIRNDQPRTGAFVLADQRTSYQQRIFQHRCGRREVGCQEQIGELVYQEHPVASEQCTRAYR